MRVGFTGTREGMTDNQRSAFGLWVYARGIAEFHHGACLGADEHAVAIVDDEAVPHPRIVAHPGDWGPMVSTSATAVSAEVRACRPHLERNRTIVDSCDLLTACPRGPEEQRSGTWATIRYARKVGRKIVIFWPDGEVTEENADTQQKE